MHPSIASNAYCLQLQTLDHLGADHLVPRFDCALTSYYIEYCEKVTASKSQTPFIR